MTKDEDLIWVEKVLSGDTNAFAMLVERHQDAVYTLIRRILKRDDEAEDSTQMVFLKAYHSLAGFNKKSMFSTWLSRIAYNSAVSEYRKKKNKIHLGDDKLMNQLATNMADENDSYEKETLLTQLETAVGQLEPEDNALITFYYMQQQSVDEISQITGLSVPNVKTRLFRIRKKLQEKILQETTTQQL
jgi:RNA polymerase sigma-70 factor (ECF subfamily)